MKKCASELQLEAFIRESGDDARAAAGRGNPGCGGPGEPGGSGVFSPGAGGALPGVGFADSVSTDSHEQCDCSATENASLFPKKIGRFRYACLWFHY